MITEAIDFKYILLDSYKRLKISEDELITILMIDHLVNDGNGFITADMLALKMNFDVNKIDNILAELMKKHFIDFEIKNGQSVTTLDPLKEKLYSEFDYYRKKEKEEKSSAETKKQLGNVFDTFQKLLKRSLSPVEISKIREWISFGYSDEMIINALKDAMNKGSKSLKTVDRILLSYKIRDDIESEGISSINDEWDHNLEETIKILKTPWLKDNDK